MREICRVMLLFISLRAYIVRALVVLPSSALSISPLLSLLSLSILNYSIDCRYLGYTAEVYTDISPYVGRASVPCACPVGTV